VVLASIDTLMKVMAIIKNAKLNFMIGDEFHVN